MDATGIKFTGDKYKNYLDLQKDPNFLELYRYYSIETTYDILGIRRQETVHSSFLKWLLNNRSSHGLNEQPIRKFIQTAYLMYEKAYLAEGLSDKSYLKGEKQVNNVKLNNVFCDEKMSTALKLGNFSIENMVVENEIALDSKSRSDLVIVLKLKIENKTRYLYILIENKVYSAENGSSKNDKDKVPQTQKYCEALCNDECLEKSLKNIEKKSGINIIPVGKDGKKLKTNEIRKTMKPDFMLIFLNSGRTRDIKESLGKSENIGKIIPSCDEFLSLNYQYLLDGVIEPLYEIVRDEKAKKYIFEYIHTLGIKPIGSICDDTIIDKNQVFADVPLAYSSYEKKYAQSLYEEHLECMVDIYEAVLDEKLNDADNAFWYAAANVFNYLIQNMNKGETSDNEETLDRRMIEKKFAEQIGTISTTDATTYFAKVAINDGKIYTVKFTSHKQKAKSLGALAYLMFYQYFITVEKTDVEQTLEKFDNDFFKTNWLVDEKYLMNIPKDTEHFKTHFFVKGMVEGSGDGINRTFPAIEREKADGTVEAIYVCRYVWSWQIPVFIEKLENEGEKVLSDYVNTDSSKISQAFDISKLFDNYEDIEKNFEIVGISVVGK